VGTILVWRLNEGNVRSRCLWGGREFLNNLQRV